MMHRLTHISTSLNISDFGNNVIYKYMCIFITNGGVCRDKIYKNYLFNRNELSVEKAMSRITSVAESQSSITSQIKI